MQPNQADESKTSLEQAYALFPDHPQEGLVQMRRLADDGVIGAMMYLGNANNHGWHGIAVDYEKAIAHFQCAAEKDATGAMLRLAYLNWRGLGVKRDFATTLKWLERAAALGDPIAVFELAMWHAQLEYKSDAVANRQFSRFSTVAPGEGNQERPTDFAKSKALTAQAASDVDQILDPYSRAQFIRQIAKVLIFGPVELLDSELAEKLLLRLLTEDLAEQILQSLRLDEKDQQYVTDKVQCEHLALLMILLERAPTTPARMAQATQLAAKALQVSKGRQPGGLLREFALYMESGVTPFLETAVESHRLYQRASEFGNLDATAHVASNLLRGNGVTKDAVAAVALYDQLANKGHAESMIRLGELLRDGVGVPQNPAQAKAWFGRASRLEMDASEASRLAEHFLNKAQITDYESGYRMLERVAASGDRFHLDKNVFIQLGTMAQKGRGIHRSAAVAQQWFDKALAGASSDDAHVEVLQKIAAAFDAGGCDPYTATRDWRLQDKEQATAWLEKTIPFFERRATGGDIDSALRLANALSPDREHWNSLSIPAYSRSHSMSGGAELRPDPTRAFHLWQIAAESGELRAMTVYGYCLARGLGCVADKNGGLAWLERVNRLAAKSENTEEAIASLLQIAEFFDNDALGVDSRAVGAQYRRAAVQLAKSRGALSSVENLLTDDELVAKEATDFALSLALAEAGDTAAMRVVGWAYVKSGGAPVQVDTGQEWLRRYAFADDAYSEWSANDNAGKHRIGKAWRAHHVAREFQETSALGSHLTYAANWHKLAGELGHPDSSFALGVMYCEGWGARQDENEGAKWFQRGVAAEATEAPGKSSLLANDALQRFRCGEDWSEISLRTQAVALRALAVSGDWEAQFKLGELYAQGIPLAGRIGDAPPSQPDLSEAFFWYRKAAEAGHIGAMEALSHAYAHGRGTPIEQKAAIDWITRASEAGSPRAMIELGSCSLDGTGVPASDAEAERWFERAFSMVPSSAASIGSEYEKRGDRVKCKAGAFGWWLRGANADVRSCFMPVARCYLSGFGVVANETAGDAWLERFLMHETSAPRDFEAEEIAEEFVKGDKLPQNFSKAVFWFRKAAELGNTRSMRRLGLAYASGAGVDINRSSAADWWQRADDASAKCLLALHWLFWKESERYDEAAAIFKAHCENVAELADFGLAYLSYIKDPSSIDNHWRGVFKAQKDDWYWAYEFEADAFLNLPHLHENLRMAVVAMESAIECVYKLRSHGLPVGDSELHRHQGKLKRIQAVKPVGIFKRLVAVFR